ncbi:hypothetical protein J7643_16760 [bacterium]|nr:hypothetical protein [bacterium]
MDTRDRKNQLQCIVDEGLLVNRRDMVRVLRDLGPVRYQDLIDGEIAHQGEGIIVNVVANDQNATVILNKRLYLNVNAFDYLSLSADEAGGTLVDLVSDQRTLRLIPTSDPMQEQEHGVIVEATGSSREALDRIFGDHFAEVYLEDDSDDED